MNPAGLLNRQLDSLAALTMTIEAEAYRARPMPGVSGSIGEHIRHCLDHLSALAGSGPSGALSYDRRQRGTDVELDPAVALRQILRIKAALDRWTGRTLDDPVCVTSIIPGGESVVGWSTLGRELAFVASHTIHHQAVIALLLAAQGFAVPDRLGYAPSTPSRAM